MDRDITNNLNDIFEKPSSPKKEKKGKKKRKQKKQDEEELEKFEDEEFRRMKEKEKELENSIPELYLTQTNFYPEEKEVSKETRTKKIQEDKTSRIELPKKEKSKEKNGFFASLYDMIFGFFLIAALIISVCYFGFIFYQKASLKQLLTAICLVFGIVCYVLSMTIKNNGKKFFAILSSIGICAFLALSFYSI